MRPLPLAGSDLGFSRGGFRFSKKKTILLTFFLGRPNWFSELSYITIKNPFWPNFLGRRQNFEKTGQKVAFFGARSPLKVSIYWRQNAFRKFLGPVTKNGYLKAVQRGTHRVGRGSTPLNPPLGFGSKLRDLNSKSVPKYNSAENENFVQQCQKMKTLFNSAENLNKFQHIKYGNQKLNSDRLQF